MCSLGIEPTTFALLTQCSTTEAQEHILLNVLSKTEIKRILSLLHHVTIKNVQKMIIHIMVMYCLAIKKKQN